MLRESENYWIDENNNKWSKLYFTREEAEERYTTLIDCENCEDCKNCKNCQYCDSCYNCQYCENCDSCYNCENCRYCENCENCENCDNFYSNPDIFSISGIGRRNGTTTLFFNEEKHIIICGCFRGTIDAFIEAVDYTHKEGIHREQYIKFIEQAIFLIWGIV